MKISGFTMVRNATQLYYPIRQAIESILPICDEFVAAVGQGAEGDRTRKEIEAINSDKIRIIDTVWDEKDFVGGRVHAIQTNLALSECTGDWCFYVQADEVVHEKYLPVIQDRCLQFLNDPEVEGFVFDYRHFWGDYDHYLDTHGWYKREVRIIRNGIDIFSNKSAQGFRHKSGRRPRVAHANAEIFHYGWVRPPSYMQKKRHAFSIIHRGQNAADSEYKNAPPEFDFGPLNHLPVYRGTHPAVMKDWIDRMDWRDKLQYEGSIAPNRRLHTHEKFKNIALGRIEKWLERRLGGRFYLGTHRNYELLGDKV